MTRLRVLCTNLDNSVAIVIPAPEAVDEFMRGIVASRNARGYAQEPLDVAWEAYKTLYADCFVRGVTRADAFLRCIREGRMPPIAPEDAMERGQQVWRADWPPQARLDYALKRYTALNTGGLSEREAVAMIRDKCAPAWSTAWEIVDIDEIPEDRTYREAWRRSANGGPIYVDADIARKIRDGRAAA